MTLGCWCNTLNQLSYMYEATDVESWLFVGSDVPMMNESAKEMIYEVNHILIK